MGGVRGDSDHLRSRCRSDNRAGGARCGSKLRVEGISEPGRAQAILRAELITLVDPTMDRSLNADRAEQPAVVMVVGVNGTGKTTTVGKLARVLRRRGQGRAARRR